MRVLFLGTGPSLGVPVPTCTCATCLSDDPRDKRLRSSIYITAVNTSFIIDCGPDFRQQALVHNLKKIDFVLVTHKHNDHIGGLDDVRPYNYSQGRVMKIYGNEDTIIDIKKRFYYSFEEKPYPGTPKFELIIVSEDIVIDGLKIEIINGFHGEMPVLGFRIGDFAYLTDFKYIEDSEIMKLAGIKILVINALLPVREHKLHFNLPEALQLAEKIKPEKVYLTHLSHRFAHFADSESRLPNNVFLAYDGLELEI
ncbi:MAG: MBL fold metallo-hydrolase [Saprospiraceae bacterium]|nr:MBL fold metallo-hydrolase [Saprospiraceae bacterium]